MAAGDQNYASVLDVRTYLVPMRTAYMNFDDLATARTNLSGFVNASQAIKGPMVVDYEQTAGSPLDIFVGGKTLTISNVALTSNVVTITTSAAHGLAVDDRVKVKATATAVNGTFTVKAAPTTTTFTYDLAGSNIASAADTGTVRSGVLKLDGTDKPIQVLSLTGIPLQSSTSTENVKTLDAVAAGADIAMATGNSFSYSVNGLTARKNVDWKLLTILGSKNAAEGLVAKILRVGPGGDKEKKLGFVWVTNFQEQGEAGALDKWSATFTFNGPPETIFDNAV